MSNAYTYSPAAEVESAKIGSLVQVSSSTEAYVLAIQKSSEQTIELILDQPSAHVCIDVAQNCSTTVAVHIAGTEDQQCTFEIFLAEHASLSLSVFQNSSGKNIKIIQKSSIQADAHLRVQNITLGGDAVDHTVENIVNGANATSDLDWVFYARSQEKQNLSARNIFANKNGGGEMTLKGVVQNNAFVTCYGMIDIELTGGGTDTYLTENVLMLDETSKVDAIPGLEIKTNDVKASHSATVSKVTAEDLFYFAARGIESSLARRMFIEGFLGSITEGMPQELQEQITAAIDQKYQQ